MYAVLINGLFQNDPADFNDRSSPFGSRTTVWMHWTIKTLS